MELPLEVVERISYFSDQETFNSLKSATMEYHHILDLHSRARRYQDLCTAADNNDLPVMRLMYRHGAVYAPKRLLSAACSTKNLDMVKWVHQMFPKRKFTVYAMNLAAMNDDFDTVKFLAENRKEGCSSSAINHAVANGNIGMADYLHSRFGVKCTHEAVNLIAKSGSKEGLKWLIDHGQLVESTTAVSIAAQVGNLEIMIELLNLNFPAIDAIDAACEAGQLVTARYLLDHTTATFSWYAITQAIVGHHNHVLDYVLSRMVDITINQAKLPMRIALMVRNIEALYILDEYIHDRDGLITPKQMFDYVFTFSSDQDLLDEDIEFDSDSDVEEEMYVSSDEELDFD